MADVAVPTDEEEDAVPGDLDFLGDFYVDYDGVGGLDFFLDAPSVVDPSPAISKGASAELVPSQMMGEIERFLMTEEGGGVGEEERLLADDFFADVLFAGSDEGSVGSAVSSGDAATPEEGDSEGKEKSEGEGGPEADAAVSAVESEKETNEDESEEKGGEDGDLLSKKRRRQIRNRDSAMKSRERKKIYVRDLEMKSKFLESECRRLQHALHCCSAENIALRQCLQKAKALGPPLAKQESAVLFVESLLLGSLFWLVSIVCLFLMPPYPLAKIENASGATRSPKQIVRTKGGLESEKLGSGLGSEFIYKKRRCKALRTKMKDLLNFPWTWFLGDYGSSLECPTVMVVHFCNWS